MTFTYKQLKALQDAGVDDGQILYAIMIMLKDIETDKRESYEQVRATMLEQERELRRLMDRDPIGDDD